MKICKHIFASLALRSFPDGESALMLVCARLRYVASKDWGTKRYLNMKHLYELENQREIESEMKKARSNLA